MPSDSINFSLCFHLLLCSPQTHCISHTALLLAVLQTYQACSHLGSFALAISYDLESHLSLFPQISSLPSGLCSTVILSMWESLYILSKISPPQLFLYSFLALSYLLNTFHFPTQYVFSLSCFLPSQLKYLP